MLFELPSNIYILVTALTKIHSFMEYSSSTFLETLFLETLFLETLFLETLFFLFFKLKGTYDWSRLKTNSTTEDSVQSARRLSAASTVLLKNSKNYLPLPTNTKFKFAILGFGSDNAVVHGGGSGSVVASYTGRMLFLKMLCFELLSLLSTIKYIYILVTALTYITLFSLEYSFFLLFFNETQHVLLMALRLQLELMQQYSTTMVLIYKLLRLLLQVLITPLCLLVH